MWVDRTRRIQRYEEGDGDALGASSSVLKLMTDLVSMVTSLGFVTPPRTDRARPVDRS